MPFSFRRFCSAPKIEKKHSSPLLHLHCGSQPYYSCSPSSCLPNAIVTQWMGKRYPRYVARWWCGGIHGNCSTALHSGIVVRWGQYGRQGCRTNEIHELRKLSEVSITGRRQRGMGHRNHTLLAANTPLERPAPITNLSNLSLRRGHHPPTLWLPHSGAPRK